MYIYADICLLPHYTPIPERPNLWLEATSHRARRGYAQIGFIVGMFVVAIIFAWARRNLAHGPMGCQSLSR